MIIFLTTIICFTWEFDKHTGKEKEQPSVFLSLITQEMFTKSFLFWVDLKRGYIALSFFFYDLKVQHMIGQWLVYRKKFIATYTTYLYNI